MWVALASSVARFGCWWSEQVLRRGQAKNHLREVGIWLASVLDVGLAEHRTREAA